MLGPAFDTDLLSVVEAKAKFCRDHQLVAPAFERPAQQLFIDERTIDLGRVEESASQFDGAIQCGHRLGFIRRTVALAHSHAAQADRRYLEALAAKLAVAERHLSSIVALALALVPGSQ